MSAVVVPVVASSGGVRLAWHARALRGDRTLAEACRLVGINRDELSRIERGETVQIRFQTLAKLLAGYQCSLDDLVEVIRADPPAHDKAPYQDALDALKAGRVRQGLPGRADPDEAYALTELTELTELSVDDDVSVVAAMESTGEPRRIRRSPFRPNSTR